MTPKTLTMAERIQQARQLIQQARELPIPEELGRLDVYYIARIRQLTQQAKDLVKFIPYTPSATPEIKKEVENLLKEADATARELLHGSHSD
ncbi:MAG TPA: hypothetical protein DEQ80_08160 [Anaerolinea thermolimosa]|uniref:Uncharacterized protein n=1 Tax=Anaerolinea thermolimosa TaxID=229919 RepID=A0A3D1JJ74_9CHLR|nr:hypothetical protein [Anaerolinea thermolimosa]GAP08547.1 hypothetical protein ATHL_03452 [Anaerolinea thermolimosa]HCE17818.1 hypothetical protein [Anaerolinea thermolimosa]